MAMLAALTALGALLAGGSSHAPRQSAAAAVSTTPTCAATVARTLRTVALRVYDQAAGGRNVVSARRRLARSAALGAAVRRGDAKETRAALQPLLKGQIHRIIVTRGSRVLADFGTSAALAPVSGVISDGTGVAVGRYTMAVDDRAALVGVIHALTGARVLIGTRASGASFGVTAFPRGARRLSLRLPPSTTMCASSRRATVAGTLAHVGERLYRAEASGPSTQRVLRVVTSDPRFGRALAADDPVGLRAAIVRLFRDHSLHVVRVRATTADGHLVGDVGGPFVLAPALRAVRDRHGRVLGRVTLSVQDDTGYIKLMHAFTGADVVLRTRAGLVPGSEAALGPRHGAWAVTFPVRAFPAGRLTVSLLVPSSSS
jgi:hypothetical protein